MFTTDRRAMQSGLLSSGKLTWILFFSVLIFLNTFTSSEAAQLDKRKFFPELHKVFWKGIITMKVNSFDKAREDAIEIAKKYGGRSYSEEIKVRDSGRKYGRIEVRIPVDKMDDFIKDVRKLGELYSQKISAPDVTEEFVDLGRRLTNLQAEEIQLLEVLKKAGHVLEILQVQSHLFNVRIEIERITTRRGEIAIKSETALFALSFFEPETIKEPVHPGGLREAMPRWWRYNALPMIKSEIKNTWYVFSNSILRYLFGLRGSVPNLIIVGAFLLVFLLFLITVWPMLKRNLIDAIGDWRGRDIPLFKIILTVLFYYFFYITFPAYASPVFFFILYLWWLGICKIDAIKNIFAYLEKRGIKPGLVHFIFAVPLILSIMFTFFPKIVNDLKEIIFMLIPVAILVSIVIVLGLVIKVMLKENVQKLIKEGLLQNVTGVKPQAAPGKKAEEENREDKKTQASPDLPLDKKDIEEGPLETNKLPE